MEDIDTQDKVVEEEFERASEQVSSNNIDYQDTETSSTNNKAD